jgi:hypothetical protein
METRGIFRPQGGVLQNEQQVGIHTVPSSIILGSILLFVKSVQIMVFSSCYSLSQKLVATVWNSSSTLRKAESLGEARKAAKEIAGGAPL